MLAIRSAARMAISWVETRSAAVNTRRLDAGTPATRSPISMPLSVPASIRSLKLPRCPMRTTFPSQLGEPDAKRHIEVIEDDRAEAIGVMSVRHEERRHRARVLARIFADDVEPPGLHRGSGCSRRDDRGGRNTFCEPFLVQHPERFAKREQEIGRRRVREKAGAVLLEDGLPVPVVPWELRVRLAASALSDTALKPRPGREHSPFCDPTTVTSTCHSS